MMRTWLDPREAATALELKSLRRLNELRRRGLFRLGKEVRDISAPGAARPTYQYHVSRCKQRLEAPRHLLSV